jgi:hypothetical protein
MAKSAHVDNRTDRPDIANPGGQGNRQVLFKISA